MEEETNIQDQAIEFYVQHNEERTTFEFVIASDMPMETDDILEAMELFVAQTRHNKTDLLEMGDDFVINYY